MVGCKRNCKDALEPDGHWGDRGLILLISNLIIGLWLIDSVCVFESELFGLRRSSLNLEVQSGKEESCGADGRIYVYELEPWGEDSTRRILFLERIYPIHYLLQCPHGTSLCLDETVSTTDYLPFLFSRYSRYLSIFELGSVITLQIITPLPSNCLII